MKVRHINGGPLGVVTGYVAVHHEVIAIILIDNKLVPIKLSELTVESENENERGAFIPVGRGEPARGSHDARTNGPVDRGAEREAGSSRSQAGRSGRS